MATYKEIKGVTLQTKDQDPTVNAGSWSSGGTRNEQAGAIGGTIIGTQTAAVAAGGNISGSVTNKTEEYNGTGWTAGNTLGTARRSLQAAGLESAGLVFGGDTSVNSTGFSNVTETYNGSTWSETAELTTARGAGSGAGLSTAAVAIGGSTGPGAPNYSAVVENWNGASWTNGTSVGTARIRGGAAGTQTSLLFFGGQAAPGASNSVELWNGSSWTETTEINTARGYAGSAGETSTAALFFGGSPSRAITESWNGSTWSEVADMTTGQSDNFGVVRGSNRSALSSGGESSPNAVSEEWSFPSGPHLNEGDIFLSQGTTLKGFGRAASIPSTTWASGGTVNNARSRFGGATNATQTAGLIFGSGSSPYGQTEEYDGSTWAEQTDLNTGRYISYGGGGTQTACITAGGYNPAGSPVYATTNAETYNGASWTNVNTLNEGRLDCATFGTSTSAILVGGGEAAGSPGTVASVESWNGASWTATTSLPATRQEMGAWGSTSTAGAIVGGTQDTSPTITAETLEWNGSAWTAGGDYPSVLKYTSVFGSLNSAIVAGGENATAIIGICAHYDGTSWTEVAEMTTARMGCSGNGSAVSGFAASGGTSPGAQTNTEEWTADNTLSTITVS
jgi:hypothetical protein